MQNQIKCSICGSRMVKNLENGYMICEYCKNKFLMSKEMLEFYHTIKIEQEKEIEKKRYLDRKKQIEIENAKFIKKQKLILFLLILIFSIIILLSR